MSAEKIRIDVWSRVPTKSATVSGERRREIDFSSLNHGYLTQMALHSSRTSASEGTAQCWMDVIWRRGRSVCKAASWPFIMMNANDALSKQNTELSFALFLTKISPIIIAFSPAEWSEWKWWKDGTFPLEKCFLCWITIIYKIQYSVLFGKSTSGVVSFFKSWNGMNIRWSHASKYISNQAKVQRSIFQSSGYR